MPPFARVLAISLLSSVFILNAAAIPTNLTRNDAALEVTQDSLDGQAEETIISEPENPAVTKSEAKISRPDSKPQMEFKPSILIGEIPEAPLRKKSHGRILQDRRLYLLPPGIIRKFDKDVMEGEQSLPDNPGYPPAVLTLYNGENGNEKENISASVHSGYGPVQVEHPESQRPPKLYYGDVSKLAPAPVHQQGLRYSEELHVGHHQGASLEPEPANYYYPKNLMSKLPKKSVAASNGHEKLLGHSHHVHSYDSHHGHDEPAHGHGHPVHASEHDHAEEYRGHGHGHGHGHAYGHIHGYSHGHSSIGPVIGKALQILIPSALFITGASALFPTRIHVPTNDLTSNSQSVTRHKRSPQLRLERLVPDDHEVIPSMYLRREHRVDEGEGFELYDDDEYLDPSATTTFGERTAPSNGSDVELIATPSVLQAPPPTIPVIKINKLQPAKKDNDTVDIFNFEDYQSSNIANKVFKNPKKLPTKPPIRVNESTVATTAMPTTRRMTPHEAMSQLLLASLATTFPTAASAKFSLNSTETPTTEATPEELPTPQRRVMDIAPQATTTDKPFFRQVSTEGPKTGTTTPKPKMAPVYLRPSVTISSKGERIRREETTLKPLLLPTISARILQSQGPKIIELGGNDTDSLPALELKSNKLENDTANNIKDDIDLAPDSPVVGLITNYAARDHDSPQCQKRALCELAVRGSTEGATKFERFLWNLASLVPPSLSVYYDLEDTFKAVVRKKCSSFICSNPNLDLQDTEV